MATVKKVNGKWRVRYNIYDDKKNRHQKQKSNFSTKAEARAYGEKQEEINRKTLDNDVYEEAEMTLSEYFNNWCETYKLGKLSEVSEDNYYLNMRIVEEYFGDLKLKQLTRKKYQNFINWRGKGKSKNTVEKTHFKLKGCIRHAIADGILTIDPTHNIQLTYDVQSGKRVDAWNKSDFSKLTSALYQSDYISDVMLYIAAITGLRISEVYGLSWNDITENTITVKRAYSYNKHVFTDTKNETSKRTIMINQSVYDTLMDFKSTSDSTDYPFLDKFKKPAISYTSVLKKLRTRCKQLDIPQYGIHSLRHTHCSILILEGLNIQYISKRLGHATTNETLSTYAHILDELQQQQDTKIVGVLDSI